jgi:EAL domain-containing protein (putative c-di-GMP-specific phosphodiesterase class I)
MTKHRTKVFDLGFILVLPGAATAEEILRKADVALYRAKPERASSLRFFEPETKAVLDPLRAVGISVVGTHFGTGYSDLQNLHRLRLDRIKIDSAFIAAMVHDREAATMVKALVGIGSGMAIPVSADGVTDETPLAALVELGCQEVQGLRYGAPPDAAATVALVMDRSASGTLRA